jgi:hypothetical protein
MSERVSNPPRGGDSVTKDEIIDRLNALNRQMADARVVVAQGEHERRTLLMALHGIKVGDRVLATRGRGLKTYEVVGIETAWGLDQPWLSARLVKQNGQPSAKVTTIWNWKKIEETTPC